jgi:uncharacterized protein YndB with AHSA1/START domain
MTEQHATTPDDGAVVVIQRIAAPPEAVFPFLVEPEKMLRWIGTEARLEPTPGGEFWVNVNGDDIAVGTYTLIDPPTRVVFTWGWEGSDEVPPGSSTVTIDLTADGSDTIVELRHEGLSMEWALRHNEGWNNFLPLLAIALG